MPRSIGLAHIVREDDGTSTGLWGTFTLKSAFQPIFVFNGGLVSIEAFEGLARPFRDGEPWHPGSFFSAVAGQDRLHVETLTRTLHLLNAAAFLPQDTSIFVNFDPSLFTDHAIVEVALREMRLVLHEASIDPGRIVCEVTEQGSGSQDALFDFVKHLKKNGFRIAVDDYGADESDWLRITELEPDIVKFDANWSTRLMETGPGQGLLAAMVANFTSRNIRTVFEGIEEFWQLEFAEKVGATMVQGYVLARPELSPTRYAVFPSIAGTPVEEVSSFEPWPAEAALRASASLAPARTVRPFGRRLAS